MNPIRKWLRDHPETGGAGRLFVYCLLDHAGDAIYIGSTTNLHQRLGRHASAFKDEVQSVCVAECATRDAMLATESTLIRRNNPRHNRLGRTDLPDRRVNRWGTAREIEAARLERNRLAQMYYQRRKGQT